MKEICTTVWVRFAMWATYLHPSIIAPNSAKRQTLPCLVFHHRSNSVNKPMTTHLTSSPVLSRLPHTPQYIRVQTFFSGNLHGLLQAHLSYSDNDGTAFATATARAVCCPQTRVKLRRTKYGSCHNFSRYSFAPSTARGQLFRSSGFSRRFLECCVREYIIIVAYSRKY